MFWSLYCKKQLSSFMNGYSKMGMVDKLWLVFFLNPRRRFRVWCIIFSLVFLFSFFFFLVCKISCMPSVATVESWKGHSWLLLVRLYTVYLHLPFWNQYMPKIVSPVVRWSKKISIMAMLCWMLWFHSPWYDTSSLSPPLLLSMFIYSLGSSVVLNEKRD